ncbi:MAG: glycosyltransferase [Coprobacter fastidiosus]
MTKIVYPAYGKVMKKMYLRFQIRVMLEISIIIPVYNAESYIERCLQSIISSSVPEGSYEIIAVDDSSSDRSLELLQKMEGQIPQLQFTTGEKPDREEHGIWG